MTEDRRCRGPRLPARATSSGPRVFAAYGAAARSGAIGLCHGNLGCHPGAPQRVPVHRPADSPGVPGAHPGGGRRAPSSGNWQLAPDPPVAPAWVIPGHPSLSAPRSAGPPAACHPEGCRSIAIGPVRGASAAAFRRDQPSHPQGPGGSRASAAITARSAQSSAGPGFCRRSTATCWRNTSNSASFAASERASSTSHPSGGRTFKESIRIVTNPRSCQGRSPHY